jgi:hypothetical protein
LVDTNSRGFDATSYSFDRLRCEFDFVEDIDDVLSREFTAPPSEVEKTRPLEWINASEGGRWL